MIAYSGTEPTRAYCDLYDDYSDTTSTQSAANSPTMPTRKRNIYLVVYQCYDNYPSLNDLVKVIEKHKSHPGIANYRFIKAECGEVARMQGKRMNLDLYGKARVKIIRRLHRQ